MDEHLCRVKDQETMLHYLRKDIQNELIQLLPGAIKQQILTHANSAIYYSIILDCTPDVSHIEQMTMIVCFVDAIKPSDAEMSEPEVIIREHFLAVNDAVRFYLEATILFSLFNISIVTSLH